MQYLLLIYGDEAIDENMTEAESKAYVGEFWEFTEAVKKAGVYVGGEALQPISTATSVRVRDGKVGHTDGPFAETKEQLGGFYLLDCDSLDDALHWASKIPTARMGTVEVRPIMKYE